MLGAGAGAKFVARGLLLLRRRVGWRVAEGGRKLAKGRLELALLALGQAVEFDFEKLVFSQSVGAALFVALELILELLDLDGQVVDYASVVVGAATLCLLLLKAGGDG